METFRVEMRDCHGTSYTGAMTSAQALPTELRRRFRTGRACLDFIHTGGEGPYAVWELLHEPADIERFLGAILNVDQLDVSCADFGPLRSLRAALTRSAHAAARGLAVPPDDIATINAAAEHAPLALRLTAQGRAVSMPGTTCQALSTLARDAIELLASPLARRIRICAADDCGLVFVDASRPGKRRWCSMERCGDRAKKRTARSVTKEDS